ncbi:MAG: NYN domain-containing protein [Mariprofundales bacterium]
MHKNSSVALFIDVENIHYSTLNNYSETPDWSWIVDACRAYGRIASSQAFGDWIAFSKEVPEIQKNGIQPVFVPLSQDGKSSLDCYLTVSAMKLFFQNNTLDTFILASGDRDYIPLIAELKALGKKVVILAVPHTLSQDLTHIVDDVISYKSRTKFKTIHASADKKTARDFVVSTLKELESTSLNDRWVNLARIGLELNKKDPAFKHNSYGYSKLAEMLDDIAQIEMKYDNYEKTIALARTTTEKINSNPDQDSDSIDDDIIDDDEHNSKIPFTGIVHSLKEGYGFIAEDENTGNVFFHHSNVSNCEFIELFIDDKVSYSKYNTDRGENAENVCKI